MFLSLALSKYYLLFCCCLFTFVIFLIGIFLLYSAVQQSELAICICISPPSYSD